MAESNYSGNLTAERLRELTEYSVETGLFRWKLSRAWNARAGEVAGGEDSQGYWIISIDGNKYKAHRLAWLYTYGTWPKNDIDHIDRCRTNNLISNLREASHVENGRNRTKQHDNTSGHVGVYWDKASQKWQAQITHLSKRIHLGLFIELEDAIAARKAGELKYWGALRAE